MLPKKHPIPLWIYVVLAVLALVPILAVVLIGKYMVPKMYSAARATATLGKEDSVEYRGQRIQLSKAYADFDEYKNDPNNIAAGETERVQQLVENASIAREYPTRESMIAAVSEIEFPGYGMSSFNDSPQADGTVLSGFSIEIPRAERERILVFQLKNGSYRLLDDFVGRVGVVEVQLVAGKLRYYDARKQMVATRAMSGK
jgi:hypothetical protein